MGKDLTLTETKALADIATFSFFNDEDMESNMGGGFAPNRISRKGNRFTLITSEGDKLPLPNPLEMYFTLIDVKKPPSRKYYIHDWTDDAKDAPDCFSIDSVTPDVAKPVNPTCGGCPMTSWTSGTSKKTGLGVPKCTQHKEMVIKINGFDGLWLLDVPPSGVSYRKNPKNWDIMFEEGKRTIAKSQGKVSWGALLIRAAFDEEKLGTITFELVDYLRDQDLANIASILQKPDTKEEVLQMLWGSDGAARKAQYETGKKPTSWVVTGPVAGVIDTTPPLTPLVQASFDDDAMAPPSLVKPVETVVADPPKPFRKKTEAASPKSKVDDILAGMGL